MNAPVPLDTLEGARLEDSRFTVPGMRCAGCIAKIERGLAGLEGVESARVNFSSKRVAVRHEASLSEEDLVRAIAGIGFEAQAAAGNGQLSAAKASTTCYFSQISTHGARQ